MDIELLEDLIAIAKYQNFSAAARHLNMTQPALSKRIASLERSLGFRVVEREPETRLTAEGAIMLRCAQQVLPTYRRALTDCQESLKAPHKLRLAWFDSSSCNRLLATCGDMACEYVGYDSRMSPLDLLASGRADVVLYYDLGRYAETCAAIDDKGIACASVDIGGQSLAVSSGHPLAARSSVGLDDIKKYPLMVANGDIYDVFTAAVEGYFGCSKGELSFMLNPVGSELRNFVHIDMGDLILIVESSEVRDVLEKRGDIVVFDTVDGRPLEMPLGLLYRTDDRNPNVQRFVEALSLRA